MKSIFLKLIATCAISNAAFANLYVHHENTPKPLFNAEESANFKWAGFSASEIRVGEGLKILTGPGTRFNHPYPWCWVMTAPDTSYISALVDFSQEDLNQTWFLNIRQLSSIAGLNYSPIAIDVNGVNIIDHHQPLRDAWRIDHFEISPVLLKEGENTITIRLQDAYTHYWIENLILSPNQPVDIGVLHYQN